ncbi:putative ADP-ribosylation factor GTPase-activating protein AGD11 [Leucoagaricus sp. SymC.cos]|nr:putative ADP-ribosylation factor GTPase-activating protein AGD11 [Leucoagaricus sp. SymC.cos]
MPGGKRNPLSMTHMLETLGDVVQGAKTKMENSSRLSSVLGKVDQRHAELPPETTFVDLSIQFIGASGLPKMDVVGTADPYFVARIDKRISFVSKVIKNNLAPVWNETWYVKNVPTTATLKITVMDKDEGAVTDDFVGEFETSVAAGAKEAEIVGPLFRRERGTFWLKIDSKPTADVQKAFQLPYLFDGPVRYSRHFSPTVGLLTNLDEARLYSTWKMYIKGVPLFFRDKHQHWNRKYKAAQNIFQGPTSVAVRSGIQAGHRMLYARTAANGFGIIEKSSDVINILHGGAGRPGSKNASIQMQHVKRVKPAVYTYIISSDDDSFRFSETGAAFFVDFASKHALHSNCNETVRYSGEFHPRPQGGWQNFSDDIPDDAVEWELVIDNNSGTYAPDLMMLPELKELLEYNFPGFTIHAWDRDDPRLKESVEACRDYSVKYRGVGKDELQPTANEGEMTLMHHVSMGSSGKKQDGNAAQDQEGGEMGHRSYGSNASAASAGSSGRGRNQSGERAVANYQDDAYASYYADSVTHNGSRSINEQQPPALPPHPPALPLRPPTLPPRPPPDTLPRTSSDYFKAANPGAIATGPSTGAPSFPEPTQYISPSTESQFVPLDNPIYGPYAGSSGSPSSQPPPLPLRPGSRPTSQDYSALPPGCASPARFVPGSSSESGADRGSAQANYGNTMMLRYDPGR